MQSSGGGFYISPFVSGKPHVSADPAKPPLPDVESSILDCNGTRIGVLTLRTLRDRPSPKFLELVAGHLANLGDQDAAALVLDLRGNEGGALTHVVELIGLFLGPVPARQIREARGHTSVEPAVGGRRWDRPVVVLVDQQTASGAEALAAALQDHGCGVVIGERTFGRALIQNPVNLDPPGQQPQYGVASITIAEMFRLNGQPLEGLA